MKKILLKEERTPDWLLSIVSDANQFQQPIPLNDLLQDSLYYPCAFTDSSSIEKFSGKIFSYVHVDLSKDLKTHKEWIRKGLKEFDLDTGEITGGFYLDYKLIYERKIKWDELIPRGWIPPIRPTKQDGDLDSLAYWQKISPTHFAYWTIWRRKDTVLDIKQNPSYFSLLYLGGSEMNAVYQVTYNRLSIKPKVLNLINPGMGFWDVVMGEDVQSIKTHGFFEKVIKANPAGLPPFLYSDHCKYLNFISLYEKQEIQLCGQKERYYYEIYKLKEVNE